MKPVAELVLEQMAVGDASSLRVHWLTNELPPVGTKLYTHAVKEQGNPVAWRSQSPDGYWSLYGAPVEGAEPLYTGFKELTDEERLDFTKAYFNIHPDAHLSEQFKIKLYELEEFARAILRKAQEK